MIDANDLIKPSTGIHKSNVGSKMRVAIVSPEITSTPLPELAVSYLAAFLRKSPDINVRVFDGNADSQGNTAAIAGVRRFDPHIVGITASYSANHDRYLEFLELLANASLSAFVVVGGNHATNFPAPFIEHDRVDAIVFGEGEITLMELVERLSQGVPWHDVAGIGWLGPTGRLERTERRSAISDLDVLPVPAFDLLPYEFYRSVERMVPTMLYRGSVSSWYIQERGCPYPCTFCAAATVFGKRPRYPSVQHVLSTILEQVRYFGLNHICFWDDIFTFNRQRTIQLCLALVELDLDLTWGCQTRVDCVDSELVELMANAGCAFIEYGVEAPTAETSKLLGKNLKIPDVFSALDATDRAGISMQVNLLVGNTFETEATMMNSIEFGRSILQSFNALPCYWTTTPLPGTKLFDETVGLAGAHEFRNTSPTADLLELAKGYLPSDLDHDRFAELLRFAWTQDEDRVLGWFKSNRLLHAALTYSGLDFNDYLIRLFPGRVGDFVGSNFFTTSFDRASFWTDISTYLPIGNV